MTIYSACYWVWQHWHGSSWAIYRIGVKARTGQWPTVREVSE